MTSSPDTPATLLAEAVATWADPFASDRHISGADTGRSDMMDPTLEAYWIGIHADLRGIFGPAGEDVVVTADEAASLLRVGVTTARAALEIGAGNRLEPVNDA